MFRTLILCMPLLLASVLAEADDTVVDEAKKPPPSEAKRQEAKREPAKSEDAVKMTGMSILGNDEAPKSLVIVPWKGSQLGDMPGLSRLLDDSTQPVDKDVFMRELAYYQIKAN
jgi:hypothetical protein